MNLRVVAPARQRLPRYTSYPTAAEMSPVFDPQRALAALQRSNADPIPADLAIYVHIPFCRELCWYCGCNRRVTRNAQVIEDYLAVLLREIELLAQHVDGDRQVRLLQIGGGTPNILRDGQLARLLAALRARLRFSEDLDAGIEIDPRICDEDQLSGLRQLGFSRVSFGIQDLDPVVQQAINRVQPAEVVLPLLRAARRLRFASVNADLVYGLPGQTADSLGNTIDQLAAAGIDRLALFEYAHLPRMFPAQRLLERTGVPGEEEARRLQQAAAARLRALDYQRVGLDHYARPADPLLQARRSGTLRRGFQGYFAGADLDLVGLGVSAISEFGDALLQNEKSLRGYRERIGRGELAWCRACFKDGEDHLRGDWIEQLMCYGSVRRDRLVGYQGARSRWLWHELMTVLQQRHGDAVRVQGDYCEVDEAHWDNLRELAACFDARRTPSLSPGQRIQ